MARPIVTPVSTAASGGGWALSGGQPPVFSGTGVPTFPGPHFVEKQELQIDYVRCPQGGGPYYDTPILNLSAATRTSTISSTRLLCIVTASYSRKKVYQIFDTSTYQQPQKFETIAQENDHLGNSYGSLTASSMGPAGSVVTSQPWIYRKAWDDSTDSEVNESVIVANFAVGDDQGDKHTTCYELSANDQIEHLNNFDLFFRDSNMAGSYAADGDGYIDGPFGDPYILNGTYNPVNESFVRQISFINMIGSTLTYKALFAIPATVDFPSLKRDSGLSYYDVSRHSY